MVRSADWARNKPKAPRQRMSVRRTGALPPARFARTEDDLITIKYTSRSGRAPVHGHALARLALGEFAKG